MGLSNAFNQSIFTKDAYTKAVGTASKNGYAVLKISPRDNKFTGRKDAEIRGVIQNNIEFTINATWSELGGVAGLVPDIGPLQGAAEGIEKLARGGKISQAMGIAEGGTKFTTRKIYSRSGNLVINPSIRIINWTGDVTGSPVIAAMLLATYCIPANADQGFMNLWNKFEDKMKNYIVNLAGKAGEAVEGWLEKNPINPDSMVDKIQGLAVEAGQEAAYATGEVFEGYSDNFVLKTSPTPVTICIGNYFEHNDMVIEEVKFKMSKEMTENGPLYIDADLSISSRSIIDNIDYIGMFNPNTGSRVIDVGTSLNTTGI
jgi:hypothetical protein